MNVALFVYTTHFGTCIIVYAYLKALAYSNRYFYYNSTEVHIEVALQLFALILLYLFYFLQEKRACAVLAFFSDGTAVPYSFSSRERRNYSPAESVGIFLI